MKFLLKSIFLLALWLPLLWGHTAVFSQCETTVIKLEITTTQATFPAENNGGLNIIASDGEPPYNYSINGIGPKTDGSFTDLAPLEYTIIVTDANGCFAETTVVVQLDCNTVPAVAINKLDGPFCVTSTAPILLGANVPGGNFSGQGVSGSTFVPSEAGVGSHLIRYEGNYKGCNVSATTTVEVTNKCCPIPKNVKVIIVDATNIAVTWDDIGFVALGYTVEYVPIAFPLDSDNDFFANSPANIVLPTDKGNKWIARVRTVCDGDELSDFSADVPFQTSVTSCNPASPLSVTNLSPTTALLNWTLAPNGVSYRIEYYPVAKPGDVQSTVLPHPTNSINISNLIADTEYEFRVLTTCEEGVESGFTFPQKFKTSKDLNDCQPPKTVTLSDLRQNSVRIDWTPVEGAFRYEICLRKKNQIDCRIERSEVTNFTFTDLESDTEYEVTILTICTSTNSTPTEKKRI